MNDLGLTETLIQHGAMTFILWRLCPPCLKGLVKIAASVAGLGILSAL